MKHSTGVFLMLFAFPLNVFTFQSTDRIFNGTEASEHEFPSMVSLRLNFLNVIRRDCGGVAISDNFVLTAASCFQDVEVFRQYFTIQAGIHQLDQSERPDVQKRQLANLILHPNYTATGYVNDLALVQVAFPFVLTASSVGTIAVSNVTALDNADLVTIGWGALNLSNLSTLTNSLQRRRVGENIQCEVNRSMDPTTQLCASGDKLFSICTLALSFSFSRYLFR